MAFSRVARGFHLHICISRMRCVFRELFTGDEVRKVSSFAAGLELKTSLRPVLKYHRRMAKRLENQPRYRPGVAQRVPGS